MHPGRLGRARDFDALQRTSHRARRGPIRIAWVPGGEGAGARVAYAIGRRVGGAVVRNRLRRRLRAIVVGLDLAPGDYLVAAAPEAADLPFPELQAAVTAAVGALR